MPIRSAIADFAWIECGKPRKSQDGLYAVRGLNPTPPEYECIALPLHWLGLLNFSL